MSRAPGADSFTCARNGANARITIDLEAQTVTGADGQSYSFEIDPFKKEVLLNGLDDIGLTMQKAGAIADFEKTASQSRPWV